MSIDNSSQAREIIPHNFSTNIMTLVNLLRVIEYFLRRAFDTVMIFDEQSNHVFTLTEKFEYAEEN